MDGSDGSVASTLTVSNAFFVIDGERYPSSSDVCLLVETFDEFGDGWDDISWTLTEQTTGTAVSTGTLADGSSGSSSMCGLSASCYYFEVSEGLDGGDVSWVVSQNGVTLARADGAPTSGTFCLGDAYVNESQIGATLTILNEDDDGIQGPEPLPSASATLAELRELLATYGDEAWQYVASMLAAEGGVASDLATGVAAKPKAEL